MENLRSGKTPEKVENNHLTGTVRQQTSRARPGGYMTAAGNSIRRGEMRRLFTDSATVHAAVTLLLVAPFFVLRDILLYDLPNHSARQHILFGDGAPGAAQYYVAQWRLLPNLALDAWVGAFHHLVSVDLAVRLFLAATLTQLFSGTIP